MFNMMSKKFIHKNNFDFLRLAFAIFVLFTHCYALLGLGSGDWLSTFLNGQTTFSYLGVRGFFIISGFLIFQSLLRSRSLANYYWKRILRLFPALIVMLLLTFALLSFVYVGSGSYFEKTSPWTYVFNNLSLYNLQFSIVGVFDNNPSHFVNGSLWTIPYEFSFYLMLSLIYFIRTRPSVITFTLVTIFLFFSTSYILTLDSELKFGKINFHGNTFNLGAYFFGGTIVALFKESLFRNRMLLFVIGITGLCLSFYFSVFERLQFFVLPFVVLPFGSLATKHIAELGTNIGDLSYGIYIYSFPIQQSIIHFFNFDVLQLFITSLLVSCLFAFGSWHLVEKKALKYKKLCVKPLIIGN